MNTAFFSNSKYLLRYDAYLKPTRIQSPYISHSYPNMLCRLFTHWSQDVREYLHRLLIFRIIMPYESKYALRNRSSLGLTALQQLLIDGYQEIALKKHIPLHFYSSSNLFIDEKQSNDYEDIGSELLQYLSEHQCSGVLEAQQQLLVSQFYVGMTLMSYL